MSKALLARKTGWPPFPKFPKDPEFGVAFSKGDDLWTYRGIVGEGAVLRHTWKLVDGRRDLEHSARWVQSIEPGSPWIYIEPTALPTEGSKPVAPELTRTVFTQPSGNVFPQIHLDVPQLPAVWHDTQRYTERGRTWQCDDKGFWRCVEAPPESPQELHSVWRRENGVVVLVGGDPNLTSRLTELPPTTSSPPAPPPLTKMVASLTAITRPVTQLQPPSSTGNSIPVLPNVGAVSPSINPGAPGFYRVRTGTLRGAKMEEGILYYDGRYWRGDPITCGDAQIVLDPLRGDVWIMPAITDEKELMKFSKEVRKGVGASTPPTAPDFGEYGQYFYGG